MYFLGVDPGKTGGAVVLHGGEVVAVCAFDRDDFCTFLAKFGDKKVFAAIEHVHAYPGQSAASMFAFGRSVGVVEGVLSAKKIETHYVSPQKWQQMLPLAANKKDAAKIFCGKRWGLNVFKQGKRRVPHGGLLDAACIAEYARRHWCNIPAGVPVKNKKCRMVKVL